MKRWLRGSVLAVLVLAAVVAAAAAAEVKQDDAMVQAYRRAIAIDSNDVIAHFNLGLALYKLEQYDEAKQVLAKCLDLNHGDVRSHKQVDGPANQILGIIYYNYSHDDHKAVEAFQNSLKLLPDDPDTDYALGLAYQRLRDFPNALKAYDHAVLCGRAKDSNVHYQRGLVLSELKREPEAVVAYRESLKYKPNFVPAMENLALIYHRQEKDDEVISLLQQLVKIDPQNFNANYMLGLHYYRKKMYPEMVSAYTRAVAVKPDMADVHYNLGMAYYFQTRYELAIEELKKAVALNPQDGEAYNLLGQAQTAAVETYLHQGSTYLAQEKYPEALTELKKVFVIDANNANAKALLDNAQRMIREAFASHLRSAEKYFHSGQLDDAYTEYAQAVALDPGSAEAQDGKLKTRDQMGKLLSQRLKKAKEAEQEKDYQEAQTQYAAVLEVKPDYTPAKSALAALRQTVTQELRRSLARADQALEKDKLNEAALAYKKALKLSEGFSQTGEQEKALTGLSKVNSRRAEAIHQYLAQGKKAASGGDEAKAKEAFNAVLKLDPQNKSANEYIVKLTGTQSQAKVTDEEIKTTYYRGVDYYVNGKINEAIKEWEKVIKLDPENQDARINISRAKAKLVAIRKLTDGY